MEFKEAMRAWNRMCDAQNECEICPCDENCMLNLGVKNIDVSELEKTLEKWAEEHPEKTRMDDFLEKHPRAPLDDNDTPRACAKQVGYCAECVSSTGAADCVKCWRRPLEEVEG